MGAERRKAKGFPDENTPPLAGTLPRQSVEAHVCAVIGKHGKVLPPVIGPILIPMMNPLLGLQVTSQFGLDY